jgi:hypothetical protein
VPSTDPSPFAAHAKGAPGEERDLRYEIKMVIQESAYTWALESLRLDPSGVRVLYPPRRVQSVYFDTLGQTALEENLAGIGHREKIRFRWYGDASSGVHGQLERKVRHNQLGWKDVEPIAAAIDVEGASRQDFARAILGSLSDEWADVSSSGVLPVQWISYLREYYSTADSKVRITLDRELSTADQRGRMHLTQQFPNPVPHVLIVEAKCDKDHHDFARRILSCFPLFVDKCSKFVIASRPEEGPSISIHDRW